MTDASEMRACLFVNLLAKQLLSCIRLPLLIPANMSQSHTGSLLPPRARLFATRVAITMHNYDRE